MGYGLRQPYDNYRSKLKEHYNTVMFGELRVRLELDMGMNSGHLVMLSVQADFEFRVSSRDQVHNSKPKMQSMTHATRRSPNKFQKSHKVYHD